MSDTLHGWLLTLLSLPLPAWAVVASAAVGLAVPWLVEANVPMAEWAGWKFRLATYGAAIFAGCVAGITIWHSTAALALWVPALAVNCARDAASHFLPWLSPRAQAVAVKRSQDGSTGYHVPGIDGTVWTKPDPTVPKPPEDHT